MRSFSNIDGIKEFIYAGDYSIFERLSNPIRISRNDAGGSQSATNEYEATLLIDMCSAIIDANRAGVFNDANIVRNADIIIRSVAKVGIFRQKNGCHTPFAKTSITISSAERKVTWI